MMLMDTLKLHGEVRLGLEVVEYIVAFALVVDLVSELSLAPLVDVGKGTVCLDEVSELCGERP